MPYERQKAYRERRKAERDRMTKALKAIEDRASFYHGAESIIAMMADPANYAARGFDDIHRLAKEGLGDE